MKEKQWTYLLIGCILLSPVAFAQTENKHFSNALESFEQTMQTLTRSARMITDAASREIESADTWEPLRGKRRDEMLDMLGLLPLPERTSLRARITGTLEHPEYRIEKLVFESLPRIYVTANLYIPRNRTGPLPAVVYVCGHAYSRFGNKTSYQRHGISLARNGYVAIILDSIQVAETFALHHGIHSQEMYEWYARGYTPAGVEVWNAIRAIDYLQTRPEVDPEKIGMTGRSGGAAMTWFTASVDPRIKVAVPVMGISTYAANLVEDTQKHHCDCMFVINAHRHGMLHQGALIAPRPLLMAHGSLDVLFPVAGYEEFEQKVGQLYESYGRREAFRNIVVETKHADSDFLREQAIRWFDRYLKGIDDRDIDLTLDEEDPQNLAVFPEGPPEDAGNYRVHETFIPTPPFKQYSSLEQWGAHRRDLLGKINSNVFRAFPVSTNTPELNRKEEVNWYFQAADYESEPGVRIDALLHIPEEIDTPLPAVLYVASPGEDPQSIQEIFSQARNPGSVMRMVVYPRGIGAVSWTKYQWKTILRNAMYCGHTVDSLRLWDVLQGVKILRSMDGVNPDRITILGNGISGILGLYAALLDPNIHQVFLIRPPVSHVDGPIFLNILRFLDLPEAAALLAPRRLNFYSRMPAVFEASREIYSLYGKPGHLYVSMDIEAVLQGRYNHRFSSGR